jgi:predicted kinase
MAILICMHGLPRSGKSTVARQLAESLRAPIVSRDCIRLALHGQPYISLAEPFVRAISKVMVAALFEAGHEYVVADETHWSRAARNFMRDGKWETYFYPVMTDAPTCMQRAVDTNQPWLLEVIPAMAARHEPLEDDEPIWSV